MSKNKLTTTKIKELKQKIKENFPMISNLINLIFSTFLQNPQNLNKSLIINCLDAYETFLNWINIKNIIDSKMIETFIAFLNYDFLSLKSLKCLNNVFALKNIDKKEEEKDYFKILFRSYPSLLEKIKKNIIVDFNLESEYARNAKTNAQSFNDFDLKIQVIFSH